MRKYDYKKAKKIIEDYKNKGLKEAFLGMQEDWSLTAETIWKNGKYYVNLDKKNLEICGINGSLWATPILVLEFKDGTYKKLLCYKEEQET